MVNTDSGMDLPQKVTWESGSILWSQFNPVGPKTLIMELFYGVSIYRAQNLNLWNLFEAKLGLIKNKPGLIAWFN